MLRIRSDRLEKHDERLTLQRAPFTGVAYDVDAGIVRANYLVEEGRVVGPFEEWEPGVARATREAITEREPTEAERHPEPGLELDSVYCLGDETFHGVMYEFDNEGFLIEEESYDERSIPVSPSREWFPTGRVKAEYGKIRDNGVHENRTWYENGQLEWLEVNGLSASYSEDGRLESIGLDEKYAELDLEQLSLLVGKYLRLYGRGMNDQIVARLVGLEEVEALSLSSTSITSEGFLVLRACRRLKSLDTYDNEFISKADIAHLLAQMPNCSWLDRDERLAELEKERHVLLRRDANSSSA